MKGGSVRSQLNTLEGLRCLKEEQKFIQILILFVGLTGKCSHFLKILILVNLLLESEYPGSYVKANSQQALPAAPESFHGFFHMQETELPCLFWHPYFPQCFHALEPFCRIQ